MDKPGPLHAGDTFLGKYEIRSLLGRGGHAFVYEAYDPFLDRSVAIKVIKSPKDAGRDLGKRARSEAQVLSRADHKNLVKVLDAGIADGLVYLIMEKLVGRTLRDALKDLQRLSVAEALLIGLQVAEGMEVAHREQVIHRDLKPENIFLEAGNALKVLDFGIAKVLGMAGHRPETTEKDLLQGTVLYMSPEHLQGIGVTPKSDIYALGTILFEALHTHPLAVGEKPAGLQEAAWMQIAKVPPMLDVLDPAIPHFVAKLVHRAIVKKPEQRYATMRDFREALSAALLKLREEGKAQPGRYSVRDLSLAQLAPASDGKRLPRDTVRAVPVMTNQVTVKAPAVAGGDTERVGQPPFSAPAHAAPTPLLVAAAALPRDDRTPLIFGTVDHQVARAPAPSSEKPTIYSQGGTRTSQADHPTHTVAPMPANFGAARAGNAHAKSVPPSTAPPVSSRLAAPPAQLAHPLSKDRNVRIAALAALVVGIVVGTTYGFVVTRQSADARSAVQAPPAPTFAMAAVPPVREVPVVSPVMDPATLPSATASAVTASAPTKALAPAAPPPSAKVTRVNPASAPRVSTDAELQQRLEWLDRAPNRRLP